MASNYLVGIGGTGARCLEAVVYLAAAGLFRKPLHVLLIDPDQNNGNATRTRELIEAYQKLTSEPQPRTPKSRGLRSRRLNPPQVFSTSINAGPSGNVLPFFWNDPNPAGRTFKQAIDYASLPEALREFVDIFYSSEDLGTELQGGYQGRTNVGSISLKQDLQATSAIPELGILEFGRALDVDLKNEESRVFVIGSLFGGSGASGIPVVPLLIRDLPAEVLAPINRSRVRFGCAMMAPYFSFPPPRDGYGPGLDSARHPLATKAALLHYSQLPSGYQHAYLIGAPARPITNTGNFRFGENQQNSAHFAELVAALAARDFFDLPSIGSSESELHFADSTQDGVDLGVTWETLPVGQNQKAIRQETKYRLVTLATFCYLFERILLPDIRGAQTYLAADWYRSNFESQLYTTTSDRGDLRVRGDEPSLSKLAGFCASFLAWLSDIGDSAPEKTISLFNWNALKVNNELAAADLIGNLMGNAATTPLYLKGSYNKLLSLLQRLRLHRSGDESSVGLLIYLLHEAASEFCQKNYHF
jgi:hypothetical protein